MSFEVPLSLSRNGPYKKNKVGSSDFVTYANLTHLIYIYLTQRTGCSAPDIILCIYILYSVSFIPNFVSKYIVHLHFPVCRIAKPYTIYQYP